ncbi:efflux RND transporter permease subunit [Anaerobacillus sp. HL2]|nr:efflux RND transporter permease subunit [Anaerobacillus sp. HL2]
MATRYKTDGSKYDVRVMLPEDSRQTIRDIETTVIQVNYSVNVPLAVAELRQTQGQQKLISNQERQVRVTSDIVDRDLGSIITDLETRLNQLNTPDGYRITIGGQAEDMAESFTQLGMALVLHRFSLYMVMAIPI